MHSMITIFKSGKNGAGIFLISLFVALMLSSASAAYSGSGNGTLDDPYQITTLDELNEIRENLSAHYRLTADLDMAEMTGPWEPVGDIDNPFSGTFDGNGKQIINLEVCPEYEEENAGFFGQTEINAQIRNLTLKDARIENGHHSGVLVGYNHGNIENCHVIDSAVLSIERAGGLVGTHYFGTISNSSVSGKITGREAGGLVGINNRGTIQTSSSNATVFGDWSAGGFAGRNYHGNISNCMSEGITYGTGLAGGFVGSNHVGTIEYCYTTNAVDAKIETGGFVGVNQGHIKNCISMNEYINNRPLFSHEDRPYPPYRIYIFGTGGPIGRIACANYTTDGESKASIENCHSWKRTKSNRMRFSGINGKVVQTEDLQNTFPNSVWTGWDENVWETGLNGLPRIK